jgi:hypothetical protein
MKLSFRCFSSVASRPDTMKRQPKIVVDTRFYSVFATKFRCGCDTRSREEMELGLSPSTVKVMMNV